MLLPTLHEIEQIHKELAPDTKTFELVYIHSQVIKEIAFQLIEKNNLRVDSNFIQAGCLLHDIGAYRLLRQGRLHGLEDYIRHGVEGYAIMKEKGYPESLCRVCSHHTGVGLSKEKVIREGLPLPIADYLAETTEEKLIMYADKFHSKTPQFNSFDTYKKYISQFGLDDGEKFEAMKELFGSPYLDDLAKQYHMEIK